MKKNESALLRRKSGFYNISEVGEILGVPHYIVRSWFNSAAIIPPSHTYMGGNRRYYAKKEVEKIKLIFNGSDDENLQR